MSDAGTLALALTIGFAATYLLTPVAIRIARRTDFLDRPRGYKGHAQPTPYLGGVAVLAGFGISAFALEDGFAELWPIAALAGLLCAVGTLDDRRNVSPGTRMLAEICAALGLFAAGFGWEYFSGDAANLALTIVFVVGVVNAFNLMDNQDGATGTVAMVAAAGTGVLAMIEGAPALAALCLGLAGACAGFLRYNLASPVRIFLGDGGSMPLGFIVAASIMALDGGAEIGWAMVLVTVILVGLPALDTALVIISRLRRGASVHKGSRDHLTHRLLVPLGSVRRVALALAVGQASLCAVGIGIYQADRDWAILGASACILVGTAVIAVLETPRWAPALQEASLYEGTPGDLSLTGPGEAVALSPAELAATLAPVGTDHLAEGSGPDGEPPLQESLA